MPFIQREIGNIAALIAGREAELLEMWHDHLGKADVAAVAVRLTTDRVYIELSDGREIGVPIAHYDFLRQASAEALAHWTLEPRGFAVYWPDLKDGLEVRHLLDPQPL